MQARGYYTNTKLSECEFVELFKCLPSIQVLRISQLYIEVILNLIVFNRGNSKLGCFKLLI